MYLTVVLMYSHFKLTKLQISFQIKIFKKIKKKEYRKGLQTVAWDQTRIYNKKRDLPTK